MGLTLEVSCRTLIPAFQDVVWHEALRTARSTECQSCHIQWLFCRTVTNVWCYFSNRMWMQPLSRRWLELGPRSSRSPTMKKKLDPSSFKSKILSGCCVGLTPSNFLFWHLTSFDQSLSKVPRGTGSFWIPLGYLSWSFRAGWFSSFHHACVLFDGNDRFHDWHAW